MLAFVVDLAFAYSQNNTGLGLFLGLCSDVQATCGGFLSLVLLDDDAITERLMIHSVLPFAI